ncbi:adaptor protein MecA [Lactobacillus taiwanensis]|uniref:adaptor protein MecA n=1 Tax=Lactobacillus taiwanensis TaxID=508451 RepID=UPI002431CDDD|nr:adaptor protein MecA [Lactobacillus taiwanensis]
MEVHRISENTIRVTMDADELKERGITMLDLLGNKSQIQKFFYQILSEVDTDHTFAKEDPVTFQVMPSSSGLELLISKVPDSDTDTRDDSSDQLRDLLKGLGTESDTDQRRTEINDQDKLVSDNRRVFKLESIDLVAALADALKVDGLASSLYTYRHEYYLDLSYLDDNYVELKPEDTWVIANEYGNGMTEKQFQKIKKNAKCLIRQDALGNLRQYFD